MFCIDTLKDTEEKGNFSNRAKKLRKNYIGIDTNEKYVKIAEKRLKELESESGLFRVAERESKNLQMELKVI